MIPYMMRGSFYPTPFTARCAAYKECCVCHGCNNYNRDELACRWCEVGHKVQLICHHTPELMSKMKKIERIIGPMFNLQNQTGTVNVADLDTHADVVQMAEDLGKSGKMRMDK